MARGIDAPFEQAHLNGELDAGGFGALGRFADDLRRSEFFQWFSLTPDGDGAVYRPEGPAFRDKVTFRAKTEGGRLSTVTLELARPFIDNPRTRPFAVDIVKSLIAAVAGEVPLTHVLERDMLSSQCGADPALAALHGHCSSYEQQIGSFSIEMRNTPHNTLVVAIERSPAA